MGDNWAIEAMLQGSTHSWEECLEPGERLGGPTRWGSSFWSAFKQCPYLLDFTRNRGWRPVEVSEPLEVGGLVHEALARYYATALSYLESHGAFDKAADQECLEAAYGLIRRASLVAKPTADDAQRLVRARLALYGPGTVGDDRLDTYGVEVEMGVEEPFCLTTRLDRWCWSDQLKGAVLHELKTAARRDGRLLSSYRMDFQFLIQQYLWRRVQGKKRPLRAYHVDLITKAQEPEVTVEVVPIDDRLLKDFEREMRWTWMQYQQCVATGVWPKNRGYRCHYCELFDHCASGGKSTAGWTRKRKGLR
jgi:hypothetical protein